MKRNEYLTIFHIFKLFVGSLNFKNAQNKNINKTYHLNQLGETETS
jgi:hypothetical protein